MKLIDADVLIEELKSELENDSNVYNSLLAKDIRGDMYNFAIECLENAEEYKPNIDEERAEENTEIDFEAEVLAEMEKEKEKHLKGYIFDSLVYRYKFALEMASEARAEELYQNGKSRYNSKREALAMARDMNERDVIKFIHILDEVIGERD